MAEATFDNIKKTLLKVAEEKNGIDNIYIFLHVFSQVAMNIMDDDLSLESIKKVTLPDGDLAFDDETSKQIYNMIKENGETLKNALQLIKYDMQHVNRQSGGAAKTIDREKILTALQQAQQKADLEYFSIDGLYYKITNFMDKLDEQNRILAREMGVTKFMEDIPEDPNVKIPTPSGVPIIVKVSVRIFPTLINAIIEIIRLGLALNPFSPPFIGTILGFAQGALDVARGRWKYAILSVLGTLSREMYFVSLILKLIRDVWTLIEPNLANSLRLHMFMSGKSIFIGFYLRIFSILAPDFIRKQFDEMVKPINELYERLNQQLEQFEADANKVANPEGMIVRFPRIGENNMVTLDDIQSLQSLFSIPEIACSQEIQNLVKSSRVMPPLRFMFEMMNIPIAPQAVQDRCRGIDDEALSSSVISMIEPEITLIPGGPMDLESKREQAISEVSDIEAAGPAINRMESQVEAHEKSIEPKNDLKVPSFGDIAGKLKEGAAGKLAGKLGVSKIPTSLADAKGMAQGAASAKLAGKLGVSKIPTSLADAKGLAQGAVQSKINSKIQSAIA
jgi:hypothetical protein